ncbi:MAG: DUF1330 domain-containing protein [Myxococcota bacterium]
MTATMIAAVTPNPNHPEAVAEYTSRVVPLIEAAGGKTVRRMQVSKTLFGDAQHALVAIADWPSPESIEGFFSSEAYQVLKPIREKAFLSFNILIAETLRPA